MPRSPMNVIHFEMYNVADVLHLLTIETLTFCICWWILDQYI